MTRLVEPASRSWFVVLAASVVSMLLTAAPAAALPAHCAQSGQTVTCTYKSASTAFVVPPGTHSIHVVAVGGKGGGDPFGTPGFGAVDSGDLPVTPGATLYAVVAGNAGSGPPIGGAGGGTAGAGFLPGGDGGGASDLRRSANDLSSRLLVAGGGGGAGAVGATVLGSADATTGTPGAGGNGGGGNGGATVAGGGQGGTATAPGDPGAGGTPGCLYVPPPFPPICSPGGHGSPGVSAAGGGGGGPGFYNGGPTFQATGGGGGGGGGGWFGGGGGGGGGLTQSGGGGGGGSNLVPAGGSQSVDSTGVPMVQISYRLGGVVISGVTFRGGPKNPEIVIDGHGFGRRPRPHPPTGTSNLGKCGPITGHTGKDYGTRLWVADHTQLWSAGYLPYVDCMGLIVTSYSHDRIVYRLGSFYRINYGQRNQFSHGIYELIPSDHVRIHVKGASFATTVHYRRFGP